MGKVILGVFLGIVFLMFIGMVFSTKRTNPTVSETSSAPVDSGHPVVPEPSMSVSAVKLWSDYQANEVAADNVYKGRRLAVSGQVSGIKKDFMDKSFLTLASPNEFMDVHADLEDEYVSEAANLRQGQMILLECDGAGMMIGSPILKNCSIHHETRSEAGANNNLTPQLEAQASLKQTENAKPTIIPSAKVSELMKQEEVLNDKCRGGAGDDEVTQKACIDREGLLDVIKARGWCWGHAGQTGADKDWEYCGAMSQ